MILTPDALDPERVADTCIIGSGPAGMTLAGELSARGRDVLVLEAGGETMRPETQEAYRGTVRGDPYHDIEYGRLRFLGGSSNHWGGMCRPLDAIDFETKDYAPEAAWPIAKSDLDPYFDRAREILEIDTRPDDRSVGDGIRAIDFLWSAPTRFGIEYVDAMAPRDTLRICLDAPVTALTTESGRVTAATIHAPDGTTTEIRARRFVLACGGIENSRLLLHFNALTEGKLIPQDGALGRYWMEHPHFTIGEALMDGAEAGERFFSLEPETMRELGVLNCGIRARVLPRGEWPRLAASMACGAPELGRSITRYMSRQLICGTLLRAAWEQAPDRANRITLDPDARDAHGIPRPVLHWRKGEMDLRTVRESALQFGTHLARAGRGRAKLFDWVFEGGFPEDDELAGNHHMGGTRMSARAGDGIVDADLRVWGQENLFVAGSSVFPSGGHANPTFTIVQLSLRLADHLA